MISRYQDRARADVYRLLQRLYEKEVDSTLLSALRTAKFPTEGELAEGYTLLTNYLNTCGDNAAEELAVDYARIFLAAGVADGAAAIPCESLYRSDKHIYRQESWEQVRQAYAESGLVLTKEHEDLMEDHMAVELSYMAYLVEKGDHAAQLTFLAEHPAAWVEAFTADVEKYAATDFYRALGRITRDFLLVETAYLTALNDPEEQDMTMAKSYSVRAERAADLFARLGEKYHIYAPVKVTRRGKSVIRYGEVKNITDIVYKEKSDMSPKEVFYPVSQTMFYFKDGQVEVKEEDDDKEILLFARPCDLNAISRLDKIFLENGQPEVFYARKREKVKLCLLECRESFDDCFCVSMGANVVSDYAMALRIDDICGNFEVKDPELLGYFADEVPIDFTPEFVKENARALKVPHIDREKLGEVCALDYWKQYDEKCIGCGGCNTSCPTCSCFDTVDIIYDETSNDGERRRVWSGCMLDTFTEMAGGGKSRETRGANMRFKVLHKIYDYRLRFGGDEHMCVGCGRCVERCPQKIDYVDVVNGLYDLLEEEAK